MTGDLHPDDADLPTRDGLGDARPDVDRVRMDAVRAAAELALFGGGAAARLGRFELIGRIAGGGMGVVYEARDPQLGRKVALKVLHPRQQGDDRARQRMTAEAQALARLDHPGVVKVHDVLLLDGQVVIVMELVAGKTLAAWEQAAPRTWREIVDVYVRAGDGLAAAHSVGVIHRDFKPANVIVGDDGRVRVLDFGLARFSDADRAAGESRPRAAGDAAPAGLTATGDVLGTLAFTAPEQLAGEVAGEAADQFSFCVALHRAIEGTPPFTGLDVDELHASIRRGTITTAGAQRKVPAWLRAAIARGLCADPADRFPSMATLLAELTRPRGWRRWRTPLLVFGGVALAAVTAASLVARPSQMDPLVGCNAGVAELAAVWNPDKRATIRYGLARNPVAARVDVERRVLTGLDAYGRRWADLHRESCVDHRRGFRSSELLDRGMVCMRQRLGDMTAAIRRLAELDGSDPDNAVDLVVKLPDLDSCFDVERLKAEYPLPDTERRSQVAAARARLSDAAALEHAGRSDEASAISEEIKAQSRRIGYPPLIIEAAMVDGRIHMERREWPAALDSLREARGVALEHQLLSPAVEAAARVVFVEGVNTPNIHALEHDAALLEPLSKALPRSDHVGRPLLLNNIGVAYIAFGRRDVATGYFSAASAALSAVAPEEVPVELTCVQKNVAMVTRDANERERLAREVWEQRKDRLGEFHLETIEGLQSYARYTPDAARALPRLSEACRALDVAHSSLVFLRVHCHYYRAFLTEVAGGRREAQSIYREIEILATMPATEDITSWRQLAAGRALLLAGNLDGARRTLLAVVERDGKSSHWWERSRSFDAQVGLAEVDRLQGDHTSARRRIEIAVAGYRARAELTEDYEPVLRGMLAEMEISGTKKPHPRL